MRAFARMLIISGVTATVIGFRIRRRLREGIGGAIVRALLVLSASLSLLVLMDEEKKKASKVRKRISKTKKLSINKSKKYNTDSIWISMKF
jgi:hypothetical protein